MDITVWTINGMIMMTEDRSTRRKTSSSATLSTKNSHAVWPSVYHIWIIREMYEKKIQEKQMSETLREGNSRGADVLERIRRKFKRRKCLRGYEKKLQEQHMSQRLGEGNSRGADVSEVNNNNNNNNNNNVYSALGRVW